MALERIVRIDLSNYSIDWESGELKMRTKGPRDALELQKQITSINSKQERANRRLERVRTEIKELLLSDDYTEEKLDSLEKREDVYDQQSLKFAENVIELMITFIQDRFVAGKINDVELKKEDLATLDAEALGDIIAQSAGQLSKKNMQP